MISFLIHKTRRAVLISDFLILRPDSSLHWDHGLASASCTVPVNAPAIADTHCAYPRRDGQAELTPG